MTKILSSARTTPSPYGRSGTFSSNRGRSLHRWYPYLEGFSEDFVLSLLAEFREDSRSVHDPFAGTGTTPVVASQSGLTASYSEINPFMRLVIEAKTSVARRVQLRDAIRSDTVELLELAVSAIPTAEHAHAQLARTFGSRPYFETERLRRVMSIRNAIDSYRDRDRDLAHLAGIALASIIVECSQMKRAGDVRYRRDSEMGQRVEDPIEAFEHKLDQILSDVEQVDLSRSAKVLLGAESALDRPRLSSVDLVLTSPPYLNGTNYFRNTKLELWCTGLLGSEGELGPLRTAAVAAGINNVTKRGRTPARFPFVEDVAAILDDVAYDKRIPELVRRYFSDAQMWLGRLAEVLAPGRRALVDIGDSKFAGVLVKTDVLLGLVAESVGFDMEERRLLRTRRSKDGSPLEQSLLVLRRRRDRFAHEY